MNEDLKRLYLCVLLEGCDILQSDKLIVRLFSRVGWEPSNVTAHFDRRPFELVYDDYDDPYDFEREWGYWEELAYKVRGNIYDTKNLG